MYAIVPGIWPGRLTRSSTGELQHVAEVAGARDVRCRESFARHYERTGLRMPGPAVGVRRYETTAALAVESLIRQELAGRTVAAR